jgi:hypothetical protein
MLWIIFATAGENTSIIPQIIDISSVSLGDLVGAIALVVSAITFYISHTQSSQQDQIRSSREIWIRIFEFYNKTWKKKEWA